MAQDAPKAVKIQGCTSKYELINGTYERLQSDHHGKAAFVSRMDHGGTNCYIFHTGKARWVISKRIDDGQRCYAFRKDEHAVADPSLCQGPWVTAAEDGNWSPDSNISCVQVPGTNDMFVKMRLSLEKEMTDLGLVETTSLKQLWRRLDVNGNNVVSLAEVDKMVVELTDGGTWPSWLNNKSALMRAFENAKGGTDGGRDDYIEKCEFHDLLLNIFWFNKLWKVFDDIDEDDDRRIDLREFQQGMHKLGLQLPHEEARKTFNEIDSDRGGKVLFIEFCAYIRKRVNPDDNVAFDTHVVSHQKAGATLRKKHGDAHSRAHFVQKKTMSQFDDVEAVVKKIITENDQVKLRTMWQHLDFNGNGEVSLAEIDKFVIEQFPLLNHKPALMRAYKKTLADSGKKDWVEKHEFKSLLGNLFYFNKLFWLFDEADQDGASDRRMNFQEFKWCLSNSGVKMAEPRAQQEFNKIDANRGGVILFDEFCLWFTKKECPQAMKTLAGPSEMM